MTKNDEASLIGKMKDTPKNQCNNKFSKDLCDGNWVWTFSIINIIRNTRSLKLSDGASLC